MKVKIIGKTESIITLNFLNATLQGQVEGVFDVVSDEQKSEIESLKNSGLIEFKEYHPKSKEAKEEAKGKKKSGRPKGSKNKKGKKKSGRPKGSKNKTKASKKEKKSEQEKVIEAEAVTQKMGAEVVVSTGDSEKKIKMKHNFAGEIDESDATKESLKAMEKLQDEQEGNSENEDAQIDEKGLDASEQVGRDAVVSKTGRPINQAMKNSTLPGAEDIKQRDPFIDREDNKEKAKNKTNKPKVVKRSAQEEELLIEESFDKNNDENDDVSDAFIEI